MDIWLIYVIKELLLPSSSLLVACFIGLFCLEKRRKLGKLLLYLGLTGFLALSMPLVANGLAAVLEEQFQLQLAPQVQKDYQAIVVLGGGTHENSFEFGDDITVSQRTLERLRYAAFVAKKTGLPVLASGGKVFEDSMVSEANLMAGILTNEFNVPVRWQEGRSRNTAENALYSRQLLQAQHVDRIVLVTHAFHMARAVGEFQHAGFGVLPAPTATFNEKPKQLGIFSVIPTARAFNVSNYVIHEYLGLLWYQLRYR